MSHKDEHYKPGVVRGQGGGGGGRVLGGLGGGWGGGGGGGGVGKGANIQGNQGSMSLSCFLCGCRLPLRFILCSPTSSSAFSLNGSSNFGKNTQKYALRRKLSGGADCVAGSSHLLMGVDENRVL